MTGLNRRHFLSTAIASMGITALYGSRLQGFAQGTASAKPARIDIHHHFGPPVWVDAVRGRPLLQPANTTWTVAKSLEDMDRGSVAASVISITNPGLWFGDKAVTSRIARGCNEYAAKVVSDHPSRFGFFAAMPLPDVDTTLKEIAYAYDTLKADGVGFFTSYGDTWLGNPAYRPVLEELNRRNAVVHVHPTAADCCRSLSYAPGPGTGKHGIRNRHDARDHRRVFQRRCPSVSQHSLDLVSCRRHDAVSCRTHRWSIAQFQGPDARRTHPGVEEVLL